MAEVAAVLNSRLLAVDNLNNPDDLPPLYPSQLITLKSKVILPPPGQFQPEDINSRRIGEESNIWQMSLDKMAQGVPAVITSSFEVEQSKKKSEARRYCSLVQDNAPRNCWPKS